MAVTESSGNGYALYNGVKLPNIDTVWTDKETYPYAFVVESGMMPGAFELFCCHEPFVWNGDGVTASGVLISRYVWASSVSSWQVLNENVEWDQSYSVSLVWSSYDFSNTDGSVYLSASSPIPLDGMTVIEWDGVMDGLQSLPVSTVQTLYRVADFEPVNSALCVIYDVSDNNLLVGNSFQQRNGSWALHSLSVVAFSENVDGVIPGIYFSRVFGEDVSHVYTSLLAYTPAGSEPDEEPSTTSSYYTSMLMGWLVGRRIAGQRK